MKTFETPTATRASRRPLMWVCMCFAGGIIVNAYLPVPFILFSFLSAALILLSLFTRRRISVIFLLLSVVALGAVYSRNYQTVPHGHIRYLSYRDYQQPVAVEGTVVSDVERRTVSQKGQKTVFTLEVRRIKFKRGWKIKRGLVLVNLFRDENLQYGDYLRLEGKLHRPFNFSQDSRFSYRDYLSRKSIAFILSIKKSGPVEVLGQGRGYPVKAWSLKLKHRLNGVIAHYLSPEEASMVQALLLGDRYNIPKDVYDLFKISGVAHIIAISGFNIGIVAYGILFLLKMFPVTRRWQYVLTMLFLIFYAFLTGGQPPVVRATIMAVVFLTSFLVERESESINTLSLAALLILLTNPLNLFDVGFQLSFISVLSIILFYPQFTDGFYKLLPGVKAALETAGQPRKKDRGATFRLMVTRYLLQSTALSLSAYLGVVALIIYYFHYITPIVIAANLVVIPLTSLIVFLGMGLLAAGMIFPPAAVVLAGCIQLLLSVIMASLSFFVRVPGAYFEVKDFPLVLVFVYYLLVAGAAWGWIFIKKSLVLSGEKRLLPRD